MLKWIEIDKIGWRWLSENPNAIHLLERNIDKIDWEWLSKNPNIYILNLKDIKKSYYIIQ